MLSRHFLIQINSRVKSPREGGILNNGDVIFLCDAANALGDQILPFSNQYRRLHGFGLIGQRHSKMRRVGDHELCFTHCPGNRSGGDIALALAPRLREILERHGELVAPGETVAGLAEGLGQHDILAARLAKALESTPPLYVRDGGFIAKGYSAPLDEFVSLRDESRRLIANMESRYRDETDVPSLKIKHLWMRLDSYTAPRGEIGFPMG